MKDNPVLTVISTALALALVGGVVYAVHLIGVQTIRTLAAILIVGIAAALVTAATSLPIRAYRKNDAPPIVERHFHDGTTAKIIERHTIDGRTVEGPKLYQLPQAPSGGAFPELLRAAYAAGRLSDGRTVDQTGAPVAPEQISLQPLDLEAGEWSGSITP
jgi:hypothetical protein